MEKRVKILRREREISLDAIGYFPSFRRRGEASSTGEQWRILRDIMSKNRANNEVQYKTGDGDGGGE